MCLCVQGRNDSGRHYSSHIHIPLYVFVCSINHLFRHAKIHIKIQAHIKAHECNTCTLALCILDDTSVTAQEAKQMLRIHPVDLFLNYVAMKGRMT